MPNSPSGSYNAPRWAFDGMSVFDGKNQEEPGNEYVKHHVILPEDRTTEKEDTVHECVKQRNSLPEDDLTIAKEETLSDRVLEDILSAFDLEDKEEPVHECVKQYNTLNEDDTTIAKEDTLSERVLEDILSAFDLEDQEEPVHECVSRQTILPEDDKITIKEETLLEESDDEWITDEDSSSENDEQDKQFDKVSISNSDQVTEKETVTAMINNEPQKEVAGPRILWSRLLLSWYGAIIMACFVTLVLVFQDILHDGAFGRCR